MARALDDLSAHDVAALNEKISDMKAHA